MLCRRNDTVIYFTQRQEEPGTHFDSVWMRSHLDLRSSFFVIFSFGIFFSQFGDLRHRNKQVYSNRFFKCSTREQDVIRSCSSVCKYGNAIIGDEQREVLLSPLIKWSLARIAALFGIWIGFIGNWQRFREQSTIRFYDAATLNAQCVPRQLVEDNRRWVRER